ncbi:MAG: hypothetical protein HY908_03400 [Myxococcales bacterium]|nr:hypothetical protein [Myxococcales bacterium]
MRALRHPATMPTPAPARQRLADLVRLGMRSPAFLAFLLLADGVEIGLSLALAALAPATPRRPPLAHPAFEAPVVAAEWSTGAALLGVALGVWVGVSLLVELVWLVRLARLARVARAAGALAPRRSPRGLASARDAGVSSSAGGARAAPRGGCPCRAP